jgi:transcriptional regulator with XRE-family HTH domain
MKLFEWLNKNDHNDKWLADKLGVSKSAVSGYKHGKVVPSLETAVKIFNLTKGQVGYTELINCRYEPQNVDLDDL